MQKLALLLLITGAFFSFALANNLTVDEESIPASSWEQLSPEISLAVILTSRTIDDRQRPHVDIYVKNISPSAKFMPGGGQEGSIKLFYVNAQGVKVLLHRDKNRLIEHNADPIAIKPGEILTLTVGITSEEKFLITSHLVVCRLFISDQETGGYHEIESKPKMLADGQ